MSAIDGPSQSFPTLLDEVLSEFLSEMPNVTLYHYTTQQGLLGIIRTREIWATHHQCLNDVKEFVHAKGVFCEELAKTSPADPLVNAMCETLEDGRGFEGVNLYVASFSEDQDSLAQWRAYGGDASGFSLGFDMAQLVLPGRFQIVRCVYQDERQRALIGKVIAVIREQLRKLPREITETPNFVRPYIEACTRTALHSFALILKHPKFAEEKEWRIICRSPLMEDVPGGNEGAPLDFREGRSVLIPYRRIPLRDSNGNFPLNEIVVGPTSSPEQSARSVESLLKNEGIWNRIVSKSCVPYRNW